jgi:PAS domain S-box-containing protein
MRLSTRLTVAMVALVFITTTAVSALVYVTVARSVEPRALDRLHSHAQLLGAELESSARGARADALGFASAAAAIEIIKAQAARDGQLPLTAAESDWRRALGQRFAAELNAKPYYSQFRLIGVADGGREIIRVDRMGPNGTVRIVPEAGLESVGASDDFRNAMAMRPGEVYVSPIGLARERGVIEVPHVPALRAASPVIGPDGKPAAVIVIHVDLRPIFSHVRASTRGGARVYLINGNGDYLVHPDPAQEFGFELGRPSRIQDDFPAFADVLAKSRQLSAGQPDPGFMADRKGENVGFGWATATLSQGPRVAVVETWPYDMMMGPAIGARNVALVGGGIAALCALAIAFALSRSLTRPLERMTSVVDGFSRGGQIELPEGGGAEINTLADAFMRMGRDLRMTTAELDRTARQRSRIFDNSIDLILVTDSGGNYVEVSPSSATLLGYKPEEMVGRSAIEFVFVDDLEYTRKEMRQARRGNHTRRFSCRYVHKDGRPINFAWSGVWSEPDRQYYFIGRDVTEQLRMEAAERQTKEMLAAVIDAAPTAIVCLDAADRKVTVWSRAATEIFGYTAEEVLGRPYALVPEGGEKEFDELIAKAVRGETLRNIQVRRRRKDGSLVDISFDGAPMYDDNGKVRAIAYALLDITERNRLEAQLRQSQKMDAIGQLTGGVAHDFNNMLTVITGTIDILADAVADRPNIAAIAKLISEAADRGAELTRNLLAFARRQPLQPCETNVNNVAVESLKLLRPTLGDDIEIVSRLRDDAWPALIDPAQLSTAILNLAINARDAMEDGGKLTIETDNVHLDDAYVALHSEVQPGPYVMIAVSDTGTGIPAAIRDKVFEPFFTTKGVGSGTGLGLSMVYGFVKQSGGHIKIYSEEGYGTTFKLYLPQADAMPAAVDAPLPEIESGNETILVVEDDESVRASVTAQLQALGYKTVSAANAQEALDIVDSGAEFDLLFTDVIMAGPMNGRRLADEIARRRPPLKVLFTSGYTENAIVHHGRLDPGVLLLVKPYRKRDLAKMLRRALDASNVFPPRHAVSKKSQAI